MNEQTNTSFPEGKYIKLFLSNGFKYEGVIVGTKNNLLEIKDNRTDRPRFFTISHIVDFEIQESSK